MSKNRESVAEKLARLQRESGESATAAPVSNADLVAQLTHEDAGEPDFAGIAEKLKGIKEVEKEPSFLEGTTKFTIYVDNDVAEAFKALCVNRGDQRRYATQAFADFVSKKVKELGL